MSEFRVAVYPGDGIGVEVTEQTVRVLKQIEATSELAFALTDLPWGIDYWRQHGTLVPDDFLEHLHTFDAIYLGAVGWPADLADHLTLEPL